MPGEIKWFCQLCFFYFLPCLTGISPLISQNTEKDPEPWIRCFTQEHETWQRMQFPEIMERKDFERWMEDAIKQLRIRSDNVEILTLPVIVHVIHEGEAIGTGRNLSYDQIISQFEVLNEDFRKIPNSPGFNNELVGADTGIEFCPVATDPDGNTLEEPGVHRVNRFETGFSSPPYTNNYINTVIQPQTIWDPEKYMNIWICELGKRGGGGVLGFAQLPFAPELEGTNVDRSANTDGVVIHYRAFGREGDLIAPYTMGRTTTHEVGHWLGLIHVWGDGDCGVDDFCNDTPAAGEPVYGCPVNVQGCSERNLVENYMQYTDDICMNVFTECQKLRMLTVLNNSPRRASLLNSAGCLFAQAAPNADFSASSAGGCTGFAVTFRDQSDNRPLSWSWSFPGGTPERSTASNPEVQYQQPGTYDVSLQVSNAYGEDLIVKQNLITVSGSIRDTFFVQDFESALTGWEVMNPDEGITWEVTSVSGNPNGFKAVRVHNFEYRSFGQRDRLISPLIDLSERQNILLSFRHAYRQFGTNDKDSLIIYVSTDGGNTYPFRVLEVAENGNNNFATYSPLSTDFIPENIWDWCSVDNQYASCFEIELSEFAGNDNVRLAFEVVNDYGNNVYLDDIRMISDCQQVATSHKQALPEEKISIYPNPTYGKVTVKFPSIPTQEVDISIFSPLGVELLSWKSRTPSEIMSFDISTLSSGNYIIKVANHTDVTYHRVSLFR